MICQLEHHMERCQNGEKQVNCDCAGEMGVRVYMPWVTVLPIYGACRLYVCVCTRDVDACLASWPWAFLLSGNEASGVPWTLWG